MQLRIFTEPQQGASYDQLLRVARQAEDCGYDAFFRSDHYMVMGSRSGLPGPTDAWVTLAGLARDTSRIRLGTLVSPATFRLPGPLAISVAQIDQMSGGRVEFGFGAGWFEAEHAAYGIPFPGLADRYDVFTEQLEIIVGLWETPEGERFSYAGKHYQLTDSPALPKPAQRPRPSVILGGAAKKRLAGLTARFADEFNVGFRSAEETGAAFDRARAACGAAGRDPGSLTLSAAQVLVCGATDADVERRAAAIGRQPDEVRVNGLAGTPAQLVDKIGTFRERGASRIYLQVLDLDDLDHLELVASEVVPQLT